MAMVLLYQSSLDRKGQTVDTDDMRIFLIGPMGSGKTAVGRQLARMLDLDFYDSDAEVETRTGVDIGFIFEKEGEEGFRRREREMIDRLSQLDNVVLATGGGAVLEPTTRERLASRGEVVYLQASVAQQFERTRLSKRRPLLLDTDPEKCLKELMVQREPTYRELADLVVSTDGRRVHEVAREIKDHLSKRSS